MPFGSVTASPHSAPLATSQSRSSGQSISCGCPPSPSVRHSCTPSRRLLLQRGGGGGGGRGSAGGPVYYGCPGCGWHGQGFVYFSIFPFSKLYLPSPPTHTHRKSSCRPGRQAQAAAAATQAAPACSHLGSQVSHTSAFSCCLRLSSSWSVGMSPPHWDASEANASCGRATGGAARGGRRRQEGQHHRRSPWPRAGAAAGDRHRKRPGPCAGSASALGTESGQAPVQGLPLPWAQCRVQAARHGVDGRAQGGTVAHVDAVLLRGGRQELEVGGLGGEVGAGAPLGPDGGPQGLVRLCSSGRKARRVRQGLGAAASGREASVRPAANSGPGRQRLGELQERQVSFGSGGAPWKEGAAQASWGASGCTAAASNGSPSQSVSAGVERL
jgi:hypothetical protein